MAERPSREHGVARLALVLVLASAAVSASGCEGIIGPHSASATRLANLFWASFGISVVVFVIVMGLLGYALFHRRRGTPSLFDNRPHAEFAFIVTSGAVIPVVILIGIFAYSVQISAANTQTKPDALQVHAIGHDFYWEFDYPAQGIRTINTLHIPVDRPIELTVTSDDVIHSFWVPELDGKLDAIPGQTNHMTFTANSAGQYRGKCAEFCGKGHACMDFPTVVEEQAQFDDFVSTVRRMDFRMPDEDAVQFMLDQCFNERNVPVCMPVGCPAGAKAKGSVLIAPDAGARSRDAG